MMKDFFFSFKLHTIASFILVGAIFLLPEIPKPKPKNECQCDNEYIVNVARKELGVREEGGNNRGQRVEEYISAGGGKAGQAWCGFFLVWVWLISDCALHGNGWSPSWFIKSRLIKYEDVLPADNGAIFSSKLNRISHVFLVWYSRHDNVYTIEGNTSMGGSRDGDGVRSLVRHRHSVVSWSRNWCVGR